MGFASTMIFSRTSKSVRNPSSTFKIRSTKIAMNSRVSYKSTNICFRMSSFLLTTFRRPPVSVYLLRKGVGLTRLSVLIPFVFCNAVHGKFRVLWYSIDGSFGERSYFLTLNVGLLNPSSLFNESDERLHFSVVAIPRTARNRCFSIL